MKNSANRSGQLLKVKSKAGVKTPSPRATYKIPTILLVFMVVISFVGLLDSRYLSAKHFAGGLVECNFFSGCESVLNSVYSEFFDIPVALFGGIYYFTVLICSIYFLQNLPKINLGHFKFLACFTVAGLLASAYFVAIQLFLLKAICEYCMLSAVSSTLLLVLSLTLLRHEKFKKY